MCSSSPMHRHVIALPLLCFVTITAVHAAGGTLNVGTALYKKSDLTKTWTHQDAIRLHGRMMVDQLLPSKVPDGAAFVEYFKLIVNKSEIVDSEEVRKQIMVMVADAMGGYMYGVLLEKVKASYYDGRVGFDVTNALYGLMRKIKFALDTDGRGWLEPAGDTRLDGDDGDPGEDDYSENDLGGDPCEALHLPASPPPSSSSSVPTPVFDDDRRPGSLAVPFAAGRRLYPMDAPAAADGERPVLPRYYRLAVACAAASEPFRRDLRRWLDASVAPLLAARPHRWYPVLAGASRVIRAVTAADDAAAAADAVPESRNNDTRESSRRRGLRRKTRTADAACDDGPPAELPNANVHLLVVLLSLSYTWLCFAFLSVHKVIRLAIRHALLFAESPWRRFRLP